MSSETEWTPRIRRVDASAHEPERLQYIASLMREERFDEARDELATMLELDERSIQARMLMGAVYLRQQLFAEALDEFKRVIEIDPMLAQAHVRAGACCLRLNDIEQARASLQTALDLDRKQAQAHVGMAQVLVQTGELQQAVPYLEEALRLDPQLAAARMLMARVLSDSGDIDGAIEELSDFINANPEHEGARLRLAVMQARKGNFPATLELLEDALKTNPQSAQIWDLLGRMRMAVKDLAGAETAFEKTAELNPQDRAAPIRLIDVLIKQGKLDLARDRLKTLPRRGRMASIVHQLYGDIYLAQQLYDDAARSYRAAVLHTDEGEALLAEIEAAAGPGADTRTRIAHFHTAFAKLREERRKRQDGGAERSLPPAGDAAAAPTSAEPTRLRLS